MMSRLFQWGFYRATGDIWSPSMGVMGLAPTPLWVWTGSDVDALRVGRDVWGSLLAPLREEVEEERRRRSS